MNNPFEYVNSITYNKKDVMLDDYDENKYPAFLINRALSLYPDTIFHANEMNRFSNLDNRLQYDYLLHSIRKKKRYSKWPKKLDNNDINLVSEYYQVNNNLASKFLEILSKEQLHIIKEKISEISKT